MICGDPPPELIDKSALPGAPQHGIGRPCKVGKEQIAGLMVALQKFVAESDEARQAPLVAVPSEFWQMRSVICQGAI